MKIKFNFVFEWLGEMFDVINISTMTGMEMSGKEDPKPTGNKATIISFVFLGIGFRFIILEEEKKDDTRKEGSI